MILLHSVVFYKRAKTSVSLPATAKQYTRGISVGVRRTRIETLRGVDKIIEKTHWDMLQQEEEGSLEKNDGGGELSRAAAGGRGCPTGTLAMGRRRSRRGGDEGAGQSGDCCASDDGLSGAGRGGEVVLSARTADGERFFLLASSLLVIVAFRIVSSKSLKEL